MGSSAYGTLDTTAFDWMGLLIGAIILAAIVAICILVPGALSVIIGIAKIGFAILGTTGTLTIAIAAISYTYLGEKIILPTFTIGPEEIFAGKILLFDPNVFNPKEVYVKLQNWNYNEAVSSDMWKNSKLEVVSDYLIGKIVEAEINGSDEFSDVREFCSGPLQIYRSGGYDTWALRNFLIYSGADGDDSTTGLDELREQCSSIEAYLESDQNYAVYFYTKNGIDYREIPTDNPNTADINEEIEFAQKNVVHTSINNSAEELKDIIAKWYYVIRNIAIIGLMLVLLYVGIRILLTSIASEKAKYKQMMSDWVVGLCLVFLMQYIMVFANEFVEGITNIFVNITDSNKYSTVIQDANDNMKDSLNELGFGNLYDEESETITWSTNLMGNILLQSQFKTGTVEYIGYTLAFLVLVIFTVVFTFVYLKRLLYLLFLTIISPLVALTYPLDKIRDGKAQAFDMWFKEYFFNLMIQPFHLLLYTVFISMAFDLAGVNIIYSLVVIGFMIPAEKFLRTMFGFNKASTPGFLAGGAAAAAVLSGVQGLTKFARGGSGGKGGSGGNGDSKDNEESRIRGADSGNTLEGLVGGAYGNDTNLSGSANPNSEPKLPKGPNKSGKVPKLRPIGKTSPTKGPEPRPLRGSMKPKKKKLDIAKDYVGNRFKKTGGYIAARARNFANRNFTKKKIQGVAVGTLRQGTRLVANVGFGALGAGIGLAAGIASGSIGDTLKYGASGGFAGMSIGEGLTKRGFDASDSFIARQKELDEEALRTQYGDEAYEQMQNAKLDKKFVKDRTIRRQFANGLGIKDNDELDRVMEFALTYRRNGVSDNKTIIEAMKLNETDRADPRSVAAARLASMGKSEKEIESLMKRFKESTGLTEDQQKDLAKRIRTINGLA